MIAGDAHHLKQTRVLLSLSSLAPAGQYIPLSFE